jgi:ABC-type dipeptide/oligopeptide/nickel transport system permease component
MGYYAPGDPIRTMLGVHFNPFLYAQLIHAYGLDLPWYQQYLLAIAVVAGNLLSDILYTLVDPRIKAE